MERYYKNPEFFKERSRLNRLKNPSLYDPIEQKQRRVKCKHKLNPEQYQALVDKQNNTCVCGRVFGTTWSTVPRIDHDHACCPQSLKSCGKCIRGLLCNRCNRVLGFYRNEPELIPEYLKVYLAKYDASVR
jgi:Recombination endonuclease VII